MYTSKSLSSVNLMLRAQYALIIAISSAILWVFEVSLHFYSWALELGTNSNKVFGIVVN